MPITQIKDEDRLYGSLNEGALIYINSYSKSFQNKLGMAYQVLYSRFNQDFYIYRNGHINEQVPTYKKDDWKLPKPDGGGLTFRGVAHWKKEETEIMKNLNFFMQNYEVVKIIDDEKNCLDILKKLLMILKDGKDPAYMKPIYIHFLGSGVGESSLGINEEEARYIEDWCESMSYQGFNIHVTYHYMRSPQIRQEEHFYVYRDSPTVPRPYLKKFSPPYY